METADAANQANQADAAEGQTEPDGEIPPAPTGDEVRGELGQIKQELKQELAAEEEIEQELLPDAVQLGVAAGGALLVGLLYLLLPRTLNLGPNWLPLLVELLLITPPLVAAFFLERRLPYRVARGLALALLGVLTLVLVGSVVEFVLALTFPRVLGQYLAGPDLLRAGALLWIINILVFAVWYWEVDGEGPLSRLQALYLPADLLFPQQQNGNPTHWVPGFVDYLFVAFCFSTALSPADTAPLSRRAKALMMAQAAISLTIIVLLVGRSVNILPQGS